MARLHSFYISNAQHELNFASKNLTDDVFNQIMQSCVNSLISDSDMFDEEIEEDDDPFNNLVPDDNVEEENIDQLTEDDSNLLLKNLINLNKVNGEEETVPEEIGDGELEFDIDAIIANASNTSLQK